VAFGTKALQRYAELVDDGEIALLFQTVKNIFINFLNNPFKKSASLSLKYLTFFSTKWLYFICKQM
jgi:hypothetical protein